MKKLFAIAVLALVVLVSCKKTSSGLASGTLQATIGDKTYTFNKGGYAYNYNGDTYFYALDSAGLLANGLEIEINSYDNNDNHLPITKRTYKDDDTTTVRAYFYPYNSDEYEVNYYKPFQVTVTSVSQFNIQGTYTGILYLNGDSTQTSKNISGQFNVNTVETGD